MHLTDVLAIADEQRNVQCEMTRTSVYKLDNQKRLWVAALTNEPCSLTAPTVASMVALQELSIVDWLKSCVDSNQAETLKVKRTSNHVPRMQIHTAAVKGCSKALRTVYTFGCRNIAADLCNINPFSATLQNASNFIAFLFNITVRVVQMKRLCGWSLLT